MNIREENISKALIFLLVVSIVIRGFLASAFELGNDEVYYWTFALYPDWSHFDHPGMVGWIIQLFSLNLLFDSEFFLRLSSVVLMTVTTCLVYLIGTELKNKIAGFYSALLFTASLYAFIITGVFIMPDTPLMFFLLLSILFFIRYFKNKQKSSPNTHIQTYLLAAGLCAGLAMLSKYSAAFIWVGVGLYVLIFDREELKNKYMYLSVVISAICLLPILIWNMQHDFISFTFHGNRVSLFGKPRFDYFGAELAGELIYNNPIVYVLVIIAVVSFFRKKETSANTGSRLLVLTALPWVGLFLYFSLTRQTLPHWSAPGLCLLIPLAGTWLANRQDNMTGLYRIPTVIIASLLLMLLAVGIGSLEIKTGRIQSLFSSNKPTKITAVGTGDPTLDMHGWEQKRMGFEAVRDSLIALGEMRADNGIIAVNWFPAANIDYYIARPLGLRLYAIGDLENIHKYYWINEQRGGVQKGENYWFINQSHNYSDPCWRLRPNFESIIPIDTFPVYRNGQVVEYVFVYKLQGKL